MTAPATPAPAAVTRWAVKCGKCAIEQHANGRCPDACPICGAVHPAWPKPATPAPAAGARLEGGARHDAQIGTEPMPLTAVIVGTYRHEGATPGERASLATAGRWALVEERPDRDVALYMADDTGTGIRTPVHPDLVPPLAVLLGDLARAVADAPVRPDRAAVEALVKTIRLGIPLPGCMTGPSEPCGACRTCKAWSACAALLALVFGDSAPGEVQS